MYVIHLLQSLDIANIFWLSRGVHYNWSLLYFIFDFRVMCLSCDHKMNRPEMQVLIDSYNPNWSAKSDEIAPDADVQLTQEQVDGFKVIKIKHGISAIHPWYCCYFFKNCRLSHMNHSIFDCSCHLYSHESFELVAQDEYCKMSWSQPSFNGCTCYSQDSNLVNRIVYMNDSLSCTDVVYWNVKNLEQVITKF